ncbi:MAG TPA: alpha/beta fold hydrolase [Gemmatales bacterium]|nr:alpha/beta fold hydrolase [Gemmatales bacterium]HMP17354.1 alpha/beta fold hydrolase [Gemmatales bacterium]
MRYVMYGLLVMAFSLQSVNRLYAQLERYELGRKLRLFEETWETQKSEEIRSTAAREMNTAVMSFFGLKFPDAAKAMDRGTRNLANFDDAQAELLSLAVKPRSRWLDTSQSRFEFELFRFYPVSTQAQPEVVLTYKWLPEKQEAGTAEEIAVKIAERTSIPVPGQAGDYRLQLTLKTNVNGAVRTITQEYGTISFSSNLHQRMEKLGAQVKELDSRSTVDAMTAQHLFNILDRLHKQETLETDYPADRLLQQCEGALEALTQNRPYFSQQQGQMWLNLKTAAKGSVVVRVQVPAIEAGKKVPVVLALHGAGGSENLFFDGYGNGKVAKLAAERGWFVVAPRSSLSKPGHGETLEELARLFPAMDLGKVCVVGHSMGAGEALREACAHPECFAAIAALGGGGGTKAAKGKEEVFQKLPMYVGVGEYDFALRQAEALAANLKKTGIQDVTYKKFQRLEHMIIVQEALPEVFQFFEQCVKQK